MMTEELFHDLKVGGLFQEFEWFGMDINGQIGAFIAGNNAYVPEKIWESYEVYGNTLNYFIRRLKVRSYQEILDSVGDQDFKDFADSGLYAYDYEPNSDKFYNLIETPENPIKINDLELEEYLIEGLPKFNIVFGESQISSDQLIKKDN